MNRTRRDYRIWNQLGRIALAGVLVCFISLAPSGPALAADKAPDAQKLFAQASPAVVKIHTYAKTGRPVGTGSGFVIDATGTIVTNHHVIDGAASARVFFQGRGPLPVIKVIGVDKNADLAIVRVAGRNLPFLKLEAALPKVGQKVYAIGSPRGLTNTLSDGLISGLRPEGGMTLIQTSTPITHGSSGGPLLNAGGAVLGVTTSGLSGGGDLNFAVPAKSVLLLVRKPTRGAAGLVKPPEAKAQTGPKVYKSIAALLSQMPRNLIPTKNKAFSSLQMDLMQKWIAENVELGTIVGLTAKATESKAGARSIGMYFERSVLSIHGRKGWLTMGHRYSRLVEENGEVFRAHYETAGAHFDQRFAQDILKVKPGRTVTIHGEIAKIEVNWYVAKKYHYYDVSLVLVDCGFGRPPISNTTRSTPSKTRPDVKTRSDEDKARSKLALAKSYISAGLKAKAADVLNDLIARYPKTNAAKMAKTEIEKLSRK